MKGRKFRNLTDPEKVWRLVEKDFKKSIKYSMQFANLSKDGYEELKKICSEHEVTVFVSWYTPDYQAYSFRK